MKAKDLMTPNPACCTPDTSLREVASMFVDHDCGAVPVVESLENMTPLGIVTDRDIACRAIAKGRNALELTARDCMSSPSVGVREDASLNDCLEAMEENRVRRVVVVDEFGRCCGIISQADIALRGPKKAAGEVVREVSQPMPSASAVVEQPALDTRH
ncbi:MAG TPA: CBS domain-containing protein [Thermoanaerobaculia bacterium]|nr:CBS domain-containing protein [Thermoanaerobaculia bacterium]